MDNYGDINPGDIVYHKITTYDVTTRAPASTTASPTLRAYKNNSGTTSTAGITFTRNFAGVTGLNHLTVDTSADSSFYAAGNEFSIAFAAGQVGSVSLNGSTAVYFSIGNRSALRPSQAGTDLQISAGGFAGIDWSNIENPTAANVFTNTEFATAGNVRNLTGLSQGEVGRAVWNTASENGESYGQSVRGIRAGVMGRSIRNTSSVTFYGADNTTSRIIMQYNGNSDRSSVSASLS